MNPKQFDLLMIRLIRQPMKYNGTEPLIIKEKNDRDFCNAFFNQSSIDLKKVEHLLTESIRGRNDSELDLLLMLLEHFQIVPHFVLTLAPLLIQPWHHWHDRIARLLMNDKNPGITLFLYQGATYYCENLEYQSDYNEFNRKCMYGLFNIGTTEAKSCLKKLCQNENKNISTIASELFCRLS